MLVIGGGMANTFLAAQGKDVGKSLCEHDLGETARSILARAKEEDCEIILPLDAIVADEFAAHAPNEIVTADACPQEKMILDAGPESVSKIIAKLKTAKNTDMEWSAWCV